MSVRGILLSVLITSLIFTTQAQDSFYSQDSSFVRLTKWFDQQVGQENNGLYEGLLYPMISKSRYTHQFYGKRGWFEGVLLMKDNWYFDVPLSYDLENQLLIVKHPNLGRRDGISMIMENVEEFSVQGHRFVKSDELGIVDLLVDGESLKLLCKRRKNERPEGGNIVYKEENKYFLQDLSSDKISPLRNKKDLEVLTANAAEISKEIKRNPGAKLKMRDEEEMVRFIKAFDEKISE